MEEREIDCTTSTGGQQNKDGKGDEEVSIQERHRESYISGEQEDSNAKAGEKFDVKELVERLESSQLDVVSGAIVKLRQCICSPQSKAAASQAVELNIIPKLVVALRNDEKAAPNVYTVLSSLATDSIANRDQILDSGILEPLFKMLDNSTQEPSILSAGTELLANLVRTPYSFPHWNMIHRFITPVARCLYHRSIDLLKNSCRTLARIASGPPDPIISEFSDVGEGSICRRLTELCSHENADVVDDAMAALGGIASGNDNQTQAVLECGALVEIARLLAQSDKRIVGRSLFTLSNIMGGTREQAQAVIDANVMPTVAGILARGEPETVKYAMWVMDNATVGSSTAQIKYLADIGALESICEVLDPKNESILEGIISCLLAILQFGEDEEDKSGRGNPYAQITRECGGLAKLLILRSKHYWFGIHDQICYILNEYFSEDVNEMDS